MNLPTIEDIKKAAQLIKPYIHRTPVLTSKSLNIITGSEIFFKCENFQKVGAFKFRGATNAIAHLTNEEASKGVATHSSGNHAQALALAAKLKNIEATIVMPSNSKKVKIDAVKGYGANIVLCEPNLASRENTLQEVVNKTGAIFIHPYDNFQVISGQGTAALELTEEIKDLDYVITPVGGGGLLSGTLIAINALSPKTKVIAAEPEGADDAYRSIKENRIIPSVNPNTIADGLLTSLGNLNFEIIRKNIHSIVRVSDETIIKAMKLIWERMKIIVEPSSAITLGVLLQDNIIPKDSRVGIILSGGNVDLTTLDYFSTIT